MSISCGIDFGTTNTAASLVVDDATPELLYLEEDKTTIPSALFFDTDNQVYFGHKAMSMYTSGEDGRCMRSIKRILGSNLMNTDTYINNRRVSFIEILSYFLKNIKNKIDAKANYNVENVTMGRPVHFRDNDPKGDMQAEKELLRIATNVGFKNIEFQYEPIAAAFAHETKVQQEKLACVIDIGGGTSDFTVIRIGKNLIYKTDRKDDILASTGVRIGGNDFDKDLSMKCFMPTFGYGTKEGGQSCNDKILTLPTHPYFTMAEWSSINSMYNYKDLTFAKKMLYRAIEKDKVQRFVELIEKEKGYSLLNAVETSKIQLTQTPNVDVTLDFISDFPVISVSNENFNLSIQHDIKKIFNHIDECIKQAQIKPSNIDIVILTGGSTEVPLVQKLVSEYFPNAELSQENKLSSVSLGLAYDSMRKFGLNK